MAKYGFVRGNWCSEGPHSHPSSTFYRALDDAGTIHIVGSGYTPEHGGHPVPGHGVGLDHFHSMVAKGEVIINDKKPILESDSGCWICPDDGRSEFVVDKNPYGVWIEGKSACIEGIQMINQGSMHGGYGTITNGGSPNVHIGMLTESGERKRG